MSAILFARLLSPFVEESRVRGGGLCAAEHRGGIVVERDSGIADPIMFWSVCGRLGTEGSFVQKKEP